MPAGFAPLNLRESDAGRSLSRFVYQTDPKGFEKPLGSTGINVSFNPSMTRVLWNVNLKKRTSERFDYYRNYRLMYKRAETALANQG